MASLRWEQQRGLATTWWMPSGMPVLLSFWPGDARYPGPVETRRDSGIGLHSHAQAAHLALRHQYAQVWNFDAHHDAGYEGALEDVFRLGWVGCANWMCYYHLQGAALHVRYPGWRGGAMVRELGPLCGVDRAVDDWAEVPVVFDAVFVARSGALTPPWLDDGFDRFIRSAPVAEKHCLDKPWHVRLLDADWIAHLEQQVVLSPVGSASQM